MGAALRQCGARGLLGRAAIGAAFCWASACSPAPPSQFAQVRPGFTTVKIIPRGDHRHAIVVHDPEFARNLLAWVNWGVADDHPDRCPAEYRFEFFRKTEQDEGLRAHICQDAEYFHDDEQGNYVKYAIKDPEKFKHLVELAIKDHDRERRHRNGR